MSFLFGKKKNPREMMREYKRLLNRGVRDLERERNHLMQQEKKIIAEIKKMAKAGQNEAVKIMAKDLVRTRSHITKFYKLKSQLQAVELRLQTMQSTALMSEAMKGATKAMMRMNASLNIPAMQKVMMQFEKESEKMEMKQEIMGDAVDDAMGDEDEEEETEAIVGQVLAEIGLDLEGQVRPSTPSLFIFVPALPLPPLLSSPLFRFEWKG
mmetsp:Transcript_49934/g.128493  ORF Transcript_49934/g.128493 Transcript_49934/m.128493 type:complete len:211 (-) Transcript_49934:587-1219(-)